MVDCQAIRKGFTDSKALPREPCSGLSSTLLAGDFLEFHSTQLTTTGYSLRPILVYALFMVILILTNGCTSHQKTTSQAGVFEYEKTGLASCYAQKHQNRKTASGEIFSNHLMTAAHKTLPFGTNVIVKNVNNGKSVKVTINDRGPFVNGRIIDLSRAAFAKIENIYKGLANVEIMVAD